MLRWKTTLAALIAVAGMSAQEQVVSPPDIPDTCLSPGGQTGFLLEHYWQNYAFDDHSDANQIAGEQRFIDYLGLLSRADAAVMARSVAAFTDSITRRVPTLKLWCELIDHYLGAPNSPWRNDVVYAEVLRHLPPTPQNVFRLKIIGRNQPGTPATDFAYIDREGRDHHLYDLDSPWTLIIFSNPDCSHCQEQMPRLMANKVLQGTEGLTVLSIDPDDDETAWKNDVKPVPPNWIEGRSPMGEIVREQTYYLPQLPSLYLLDREKRVVVKDGRIEQVEAALNTQQE